VDYTTNEDSLKMHSDLSGGQDVNITGRGVGWNVCLKLR